MATVKVIDVIDKAEEILQDNSNVRWSQQTLLDYLNDAQREIVLFRPDASTTNASFTLAQTAKQALPSGGLRLLDVYKNLSPNKTPVTIIERKVLDDQVDDWYSSTGLAVEHYVYNPVDPKNFYVYPHPSGGGHTIEIIYSSSPSEITISNFSSDTHVIGLDDTYANAILDYMLYRAYQKDSEFAGDLQKSSSYYASFQNALGIKTQADAGSQPRPATPAQDT